MIWSHNDTWMLTGDHSGFIKYWQSNMNNVQMFQAHKEAVRGLRYNYALYLDEMKTTIWYCGAVVNYEILKRRNIILKYLFYSHENILA